MQGKDHIFNGFIATGGMSISWIGSHLDGVIKGITFYGGALVVILSLISWGWDLYKKWKAK